VDGNRLSYNQTMRRLRYLAFFLFASFEVMAAVGGHSVLTTDYCVGERTIGFLSGEREGFVFSYFRREHPDKVFSVQAKTESCSAKWGCDYSFGSVAAMSEGGQNGLTIKGETCREEPPNTSFICATKRRMIYAGFKGRDIFYTTFDHKQKDFTKNSLSLLGGTLGSDGKRKVLATFSNNDFVYEVHTSIDKDPTGYVTVSEGGAKISAEECVFLNLNQSFVDRAFPELPFRPTNDTQAIPLADGQFLFISLENASLFDPKSLHWTSIDNVPKFLGIGGKFYALPDGRAISVGPNYRIFDPKSLKFSDSTPLDPQWYGWGSSVQLQDHRIMKILVAKNDSKDGHPFKGLRYYAFFDPKTMGWSEPKKFTIPIDEEDRPELGLLENGRVFALLTGPKTGVTQSSLIRNMDFEYKISVYDPASKTWSLPQALPFNATADLRWVAREGSDLLFVGAQKEPGWTDNVSSVIFDADTLSIVSFPVPHSFGPKTQLSLFRFHGAIFALTSTIGDEVSKLFMERLDPGKNDWSPVQAPKIARDFPVLFQLPGGKILVMGQPQHPDTLLAYPPDRFEILDTD
jgi:hypothetical protein